METELRKVLESKQFLIGNTATSTSVDQFYLNVAENKQNKFAELIEQIEVIIKKQLKAENFSVFVDGFVTLELIEAVRNHYRALGWDIAPKLSDNIQNLDSRIIVFLVDNKFFY